MPYRLYKIILLIKKSLLYLKAARIGDGGIVAISEKKDSLIWKTLANAPVHYVQVAYYTKMAERSSNIAESLSNLCIGIDPLPKCSL